jgi:hypothetical protein
MVIEKVTCLGDSTTLAADLTLLVRLLTLRPFVRVCLAQVQGLRVTELGIGHTDRLQRPVGSHESTGG